MVTGTSYRNMIRSATYVRVSQCAYVGRYVDIVSTMRMYHMARLRTLLYNFQYVYIHATELTCLFAARAPLVASPGLAIFMAGQAGRQRLACTRRLLLLRRPLPCLGHVTVPGMAACDANDGTTSLSSGSSLL